MSSKEKLYFFYSERQNSMHEMANRLLVSSGDVPACASVVRDARTSKWYRYTEACPSPFHENFGDSILMAVHERDHSVDEVRHFKTNDEAIKFLRDEGCIETCRSGPLGETGFVSDGTHEIEMPNILMRVEKS
jgi:hypothetical protein